jgi:O-antigen/teichoic acid export membrane protein
MHSDSTATRQARDILPTSAPPGVVRRKLAINFFFLSAGEMTAKLLTFASFSYLARTLGPGNYGYVEFALAVMVFFALPADLGLGAYGAREIAREPHNARRLLHAVTGLRMALALASMVLLAGFILLLNRGPQLTFLLALYGLSLLGGPFLLQWFFQAHDRMHWVGLASTIRQLVFACLVFVLCHRGSPLFYIGITECVSVACTAVFCIYVVRRMGYGWPWPDLRIPSLMGHLGEAAPIGLTELAWAFMWYFCTVLLGLMFSDQTLGWFGASHRILMALHTFVWLYFFNLLPSISRCVGRPDTILLGLMNASLRFVAWAGLFGAALLTVLGPHVLSIVYGQRFRAASPSFAILMWMLPVAMLSGHHRYILIAYHHQRKLLRCTVISAISAVLLGIALVPVYGGVGAAWALLIANIINFVLVYRAVEQSVAEVPVHTHLFAPLTALLASGVCYFVISLWNPWVAVLAAAALYLGMLARSGGRQLLLFAIRIVRPAQGPPAEPGFVS